VRFPVPVPQCECDAISKHQRICIPGCSPQRISVCERIFHARVHAHTIYNSFSGTVNVSVLRARVRRPGCA
jgi:hypothetical protein